MSTDELINDIAVDRIQELVDRYQSLSDHERQQQDEADVRQQYINPLLRALGWDTTTDQVKPEQRTLVGDADYALSLKGREQFFIEAKPFREDLDGTRRVRGEEQPYIEQAIDYAWHQGCDWAVLTNFAELRLYFTHISKDRIEEGLVFKIEADDFVTDEGLEKLSNLSKPAVQQGNLDHLELERERESVTKEILNVLSDARIQLTHDVHSTESSDPEEILEGVQRILDRLVVMRVAEDRSIIARDTLRQMAENWESTTMNPDLRTLMGDLKNSFRDFDSVYNSELFAEHPCEDYDVSNEILMGIIEELYEYNFSYIGADILGSIYEDYLGYVIEDKQDELDLIAQEDERREEGIYYTPVPVVKYIVESTLGKRIDAVMDDVRTQLEGDDPDLEAARDEFGRIENITVADISCGSGSFLIQAYNRIVEAYEEYQDLIHDTNGGVGIGNFNSIQISPGYQRRILRNNIFGVDLDYQATEIAAVNLLLQALKRGEKLPAILEKNIRTGNSLLNGSPEEVAPTLGISVEEAEELDTFDWESEFNHIFEENGGFDVIIGNPPWGANIETYSEWLESEDTFETATGQYNSYELFIELGGELLNEGGTLGYIIPDSIFNDEYTDLREWIIDQHQLDQIHKLGEGIFGDNVFAATTILQYTNQEAPDDHTVNASLLMKEDRDKMMGTGGEALSSLIAAKRNPTQQSRYEEDDTYTIDVWAAEDDYEILETMEADTVDWSNVVDNGRGDETGRTGKVMKCPYCLEWDTYPQKRAESKGGGYYSKTCTHCGEEYEFEDAAETTNIVSETPTESHDHPIYYGEHINRYRITDTGYIDTDVQGQWLRNDERFEPPKLLIRRTGVGFFATMDYTNARALKANLVFRLIDDRENPYDQYDLEYFLGFLNSRTMLYYYAKTQGIVEWQSFPRHTQTFIMSLPIPSIDFEDPNEREMYEEFVDLVSNAVEGDEKIESELDWDIEEKVLDLYGIAEEQRPRIWNELKELQRLRIVRELFPNSS